MPRPDFDSPYGIHGQMQKLAEHHGVDTGELYLTATKLLVNLDPNSDFDPNSDDLLQSYLERCDE